MSQPKLKCQHRNVNALCMLASWTNCSQWLHVPLQKPQALSSLWNYASSNSYPLQMFYQLMHQQFFGACHPQKTEPKDRFQQEASQRWILTTSVDRVETICDESNQVPKLWDITTILIANGHSPTSINQGQIHQLQKQEGKNTYSTMAQLIKSPEY